MGNNKFENAEAIAELKKLAKNGEVLKLAELLKRDGLTKRMRKEIEKALLRGIRTCGKLGEIYDVEDLLKLDGLGDAVMIAAIRYCKRYRRGFYVVNLLGRDNLSDPVVMEVIRFCRDEGMPSYLAGLLDKKLSDNIKKEIEPAIIEGIKMCESKKSFFEIGLLIKMRGVSGKVRKIASDVLRKNLISPPRDLLLDDTVRPPAGRQRNMLEKAKPRPRQPY